MDKICIHGYQPPIISVCFEVTNLCIGSCPYCLIEKKQSEKSYSNLCEVLDVLLKRGVKRFGFSGGEPLLRKDIYKIGMFIRNQGAASLLRTSAGLPISLLKCKESFNLVDISFDSIDVNIFRACRPNIDYKMATENIKKLVDRGIICRVNVLITRLNIVSLMPTLLWLISVGVCMMRIQKVLQRGKAKQKWNKLAIGFDDEAHIIECLNNLSEENKSKIQFVSDMSSSLCIVKSDGSMYTSSDKGLVFHGHCCDKSTYFTISRKIQAQQLEKYVSHKQE